MNQNFLLFLYFNTLLVGAGAVFGVLLILLELLYKFNSDKASINTYELVDILIEDTIFDMFLVRSLSVSAFTNGIVFSFGIYC